MGSQLGSAEPVHADALPEHTQRARRWPLVVGAALALAMIGAPAYWFGIRNMSDHPATAQSATQTFKVQGVPFTFAYPADFAQATTPPLFVWIAGISPVDVLDVRQVDTREYSVQGLTEVMGTRLRAEPGVTVAFNGDDVAGSIKDVTFTVDSGTTTPLKSRLVYFSAGGSSWQLECQSQVQNRATIEVACAMALATLTVS